MDGNKLSEFLSKRDSRVTTIEIANTLYQTLGKVCIPERNDHRFRPHLITHSGNT